MFDLKEVLKKIAKKKINDGWDIDTIQQWLVDFVEEIVTEIICEEDSNENKHD